jgi:hypothetical protein
MLGIAAPPRCVEQAAGADQAPTAPPRHPSPRVRKRAADEQAD